MRSLKCLALEVVVLILGVVLGVIAAAYQPELTKYIRGISGYVQVAEYRVSVIGDPFTSASHGIEYLKINSQKEADNNFTLHLEYRVEGLSKNIHDAEPLQHEKEYRYSWRENSYILRIENISEGLDGADIAIYQSRIQISD